MWRNLSSLFRLNLSVLILFFCDRISKYLALQISAGDFISLEKSTPFRFFKIESYINPGIAFSIFLPKVIIAGIILVVLLILLAVLIQAYRKKDEWSIAGFSFIIIGAISNGIDRLVYGGVVDFISTAILPVFNLADMLIILGVAVIIFKYVQEGYLRKKVPKKS